MNKEVIKEGLVYYNNKNQKRTIVSSNNEFSYFVKEASHKHISQKLIERLLSGYYSLARKVIREDLVVGFKYTCKGDLSQSTIYSVERDFVCIMYKDNSYKYTKQGIINAFEVGAYENPIFVDEPREVTENDLVVGFKFLNSNGNLSEIVEVFDKTKAKIKVNQSYYSYSFKSIMNGFKYTKYSKPIFVPVIEPKSKEFRFFEALMKDSILQINKYQLNKTKHMKYTHFPLNYTLLERVNNSKINKKEQRKLLVQEAFEKVSTELNGLKNNLKSLKQKVTTYQNQTGNQYEGLKLYEAIQEYNLAVTDYKNKKKFIKKEFQGFKKEKFNLI